MAKILIVDEAELFLKLEHSFLHRAGFHLYTASSPEELIRRAREIRPDLVLLHARVDRGRCGAACARLLKEEFPQSPIPVILVRDPGLVAGEEEAVCDAVLFSPVDPATLLGAVSRLIRVTERRERRVFASVTVLVSSDTGSFRARTKDLSPGGLFVRTRRPPGEGLPVRVEVSLPTPDGRAVVSSNGVVVRSVKDDPASHLIAGVALRLLDLDDDARRMLERFVEWRGVTP